MYYYLRPRISMPIYVNFSKGISLQHTLHKVRKTLADNKVSTSDIMRLVKRVHGSKKDVKQVFFKDNYGRVTHAI